jgi:Flp pilus assembly protein TadB
MTYTPSREAKTLREAIRFGLEDGKVEGKKLAEAKKAKKTEAQRVASEKKHFRIARLIGFFLGTGLFVATALFALSVGVWAWLVWVWAFVFWLKWLVKIQKNAKAKREDWAERLALPEPF